MKKHLPLLWGFLVLGSIALAQVVPSGGGYSIAGQGQKGSGKTISCSPASPTDAGCVSANDQQFAGTKSFGGIIVDAGVAYGIKVRTGVCLASTNTGLGNLAACQGADLQSTTSGQFDVLGGVFALNSSGLYLTTPGILTGTTGTALNAYNGGLIDLAGVATGSLPTCNGGAAGQQQYDTTTNTMKWCNGSSWQSMSGTVTAVTSEWSSVCFSSPCSTEAANFTGGSRITTGTGTTQVATVCSWNVVGVGGSTGVVVRIRNVTDSTTLCTCTLGACTTAINTPLECNCSGTFVASKIYTVQLDSTTDCGTNPGQIVCTVATTTTSN